MRKVAFVLGNSDPLTGGGFTLVETVLEGIIHEQVKFDYEICFLLEANQPKFVSLRPDTLNLRELSSFGYPSKFLRKFHRYIPFSPKMTTLEKVVQEENFDFVFFLGAEVQSLNVPYGCMIWDLQHRTLPGFPELGQHSIWKSREKAFANALGRASLVITGTREGRNQIVDFYGVYSRLIKIIPHPVKVFKFLRGREEVSTDKHSFFYPAQFWPHKNHIMLVETAKLLVNLGIINFNFCCTGTDKGNLNYIKKSVEDLGLSEYFQFPGFIDADELEELYHSSSALVYPSLSGPENLPPLEAFQAGLPVFIAAYPGSDEQCGEAAIYFDPLNAEDLAGKLTDFISNPEYSAKLVECGFDLVANRTGDAFASSLLAHIERELRLRQCWSSDY